jgi:hypothetical protein
MRPDERECELGADAAPVVGANKLLKSATDTNGNRFEDCPLGAGDTNFSSPHPC